MNTNYYLNSLNILKAVDKNAVALELDPTSKLVLEEIALGVARGELLTVTDVMRLTQIASPATLHRKLEHLINTNLVTAVFEGHNRRTKYMSLTSNGEQYFKHLSDVIAAIKMA